METQRLSKRKRDQAHITIPAKKAYKGENYKKRSSFEDQNLDFDDRINLTIADLDSQLLADFVAQKVKKQGGDLSLVELEDRYLPGISKLIWKILVILIVVANII